MGVAASSTSSLAAAPAAFVFGGPSVRARAGQLATGPTAAYARLKEAMRSSSGNTLEEQLAVEARLQGECGRTRDFREGVVAFLEKRPARYEGR